MLNKQDKDSLLGKGLFAELIRHEDISKQTVQAAIRAAAGADTCQVKLEVRLPSGIYQEIPWDIFVCKNSNGDVEGYALIAHTAS